jgi:hypothetical protein
MFKEVDTNAEAAILAGEDKPKRRAKGPDYSIRTVTHWITLTHHMSYCTVPSHYDNVPDTDYNGEKYDKYPTRMCVEIDGYHVCRWCYVAEADQQALLEGLPPTEQEDTNASG